MELKGKKVYVIPELGVGEILSVEKDGFVVNVQTLEGYVKKKYAKEDLRLWSEDIEEACGKNRKCWSICGKKL